MLARAHTHKMLQRFRIEDAHIVIPADHHQDLSLQSTDDKKEPIQERKPSVFGHGDKAGYRIRCAHSKPVLRISKKVHWNAVKQILKCVKGTSDYGILFPKGESNVKLEAYSDANFAGDKATRKSTT